MTSRKLRITVAALLALALTGCADFERGKPSPDAGLPGAGPGGGSGATGGDGGNTAVSFAQVHPLLMSGCHGCHSAGGAAADSSFVLQGEAAADLTATRAAVDTGNPSQSRMLRKAAGLGHGGGVIYAEGSAEHQLLSAWVSTGAAP